MKWIRLANSNPWWHNAPEGDASLLDKGLWVFRGDGEIFGWQERQGGLDWKISFDKDSFNGELCRSGNLAITVDYKENIEVGCSVIAVNPEKREIVWNVDIEFVVLFHHCLTCTSTYIILGGFFPDTESKERGIVVLDSATGKQVHEEILPITDIDMILTHNNYVYVCHSDQILVLDQEFRTKRIWEDRANFVVAHDNRIYTKGWKEIEGEMKLVLECLDADSLEEKGWFDYQAVYEKIYRRLVIAGNSERLIIQDRDSQSISMIDFDRQTVLWQHDKDYRIINGPIWTPHGIVARLEKGNEKNIVTFDENTGELVHAIPYQYTLINDLFWGEDRLVISAFDRLESFQWTQDSSAEDLVLSKDKNYPYPDGINPYAKAIEKEPVKEAEPSEDQRVLADFIKTFANYQIEEDETEVEELRVQSLALLDQYFELSPEASLGTVAQTLNDLGVPYEDAMEGLIEIQNESDEE